MADQIVPMYGSFNWRYGFAVSGRFTGGRTTRINWPKVLRGLATIWRLRERLLLDGSTMVSVRPNHLDPFWVAHRRTRDDSETSADSYLNRYSVIDPSIHDWVSLPESYYTEQVFYVPRHLQLPLDAGKLKLG